MDSREYSAEDSFSASRLILGRKCRGLTKGALAQAADISERSLTAYEKEEKRPKPLTVERIATALNFPVAFFYGAPTEEPLIEATSFRALSTLTARQRDQAIGGAALALDLSSWIDQRFKLPIPDVPRVRGVDAEAAAIAVRNEWGLGERPVRNMLHLLEAHGVRVFSVTQDSLRVDAFSFWRGDTPYVFLNTMKSAEHRRMDAAHELGHLVLHWGREATRARSDEQAAHAFGSAFLMPAGSVRALAPRAGRVSELVRAKHHWNVAVANLAYRMHSLKLLSEWQYRTVFIEISKRGYRTAEPQTSVPETSLILEKVFSQLRDRGVSKSDVAAAINIQVEDLNDLIFGLTLTPLTGEGRVGHRNSETEKPDLRIV